MSQIYDMGPTALIPLRRKACWEFFGPENPTASAGFEPANLGTKGQHATSRPYVTRIIFLYTYILMSSFKDLRIQTRSFDNRNTWINRLTPNDPYMGRTAPLTSKRCILYIYSTNVGTEYFKHALYSPFFFLFKVQFVS